MAAILLGLVTALLAVQTLVLLHNLWYWARRDEPRGAYRPALSVLIPARNEIAALPRLARALAQQTFSPIEVLVYNDESTDGTAEWVRREGMRWGLRLVPTRRRPAGWVGKTWACHQLAQHARGEWMVFLDADLEPEPELLETLAGVCGVTGASLVTAIPRHTAGIWDGMVTALIPFSLFTLLVLRNAERHHHRSFAFANGQVMAMRRAEYRDLWPHRAVRDAIVEDVLIARMLKRLRLRVHVMDARPVLRVRMYRGLTDALEGFSKNASGICGGPGLAPLVAALLPVVYLLPLAPAAAGSLHALALCVWTGALVGVSCRLVGLPAWYGLVYPIPVALAEVALVRSLWWHRRGQVRWKGRVYVP
jgi:glycosyltransferase involved in cell wall biosynthesis